MSFTWENGRRLKSISTGNNTVNMKHDSNGMRTQKSDGNKTTNYYYDSNNNLIGLSNDSSTLFFYYDSDGNPTSFSNNGIMYYYVKNLLGDIVQITKQDGTVIANYVYDVWGKILSVKDSSNNTVASTNTSHIANLNPYRYRGYIYDNETGLYYLQSRYYDPITGRFLNADVYCDTQTGTTLSTNMFAYCENNATNHSDPTGERLSIKAITYAQKWWNKYNSQYYHYGSDCANFVSQCLYAGGFCNMYGSGRNSGWHSYKKNKKDWLGRPIFDVSASWSLSNDLRFWLVKTMHYTQHLFTSMSQIKKAMKNIHPGAVAFMSTDYNGKLSHSVLIGRITKNNVYFYACTNPRDARTNKYGFAEYFRDKPKNKTALIAIFYLT